MLASNSAEVSGTALCLQLVVLINCTTEHLFYCIVIRIKLQTDFIFFYRVSVGFGFACLGFFGLVFVFFSY